jgi:hypothetical protein
VLRFGPPEPGFAADWKRAMRRLRAHAVLDWRHELRCSDDGIGMDAAAVDRRLGALGVLPDAGGQHGLFGRGLRDVWLAQDGGPPAGERAAAAARRPARAAAAGARGTDASNAPRSTSLSARRAPS